MEAFEPAGTKKTESAATTGDDECCTLFLEPCIPYPAPEMRMRKPYRGISLIRNRNPQGPHSRELKPL